MPPKKGKIAIIGGGLTGLSCAVNLSRKSYDITLFEKNSVLGGRLWQYPQEVLPQEILNETFSKLLEDEDIKFHLNKQINIVVRIIKL
jgi:NADPH-dependent glutamate synthase beta subunit-like oxidoreductase